MFHKTNQLDPKRQKSVQILKFLTTFRPLFTETNLKTTRSNFPKLSSKINLRQKESLVRLRPKVQTRLRQETYLKEAVIIP